MLQPASALICDQILLQTGSNFFEGLYPPLNALDQSLAAEKLNNGSSAIAPLNGYQYVHIQGEAPTDPDTIWIKGDEQCPAYTTALATFKQSNEFRATFESSSSFYKQFVDQLKDIMPAENVTYAHAYEIFDLLNVANIHNSSVNIPSDTLNQLRWYADSFEFGQNYNSTMPDRSIGGQTLMGGFLRQMQQTVDSKGAQKMSVFVGSYDTFLSFFGLANLTDASPDFKGLPAYASTLVFELYTTTNMTSFPSNTDDLNVRFLFRNGTDTALTPFPIFDRKDNSMTWNDFRTEFQARAIKTAADWCARCNSTVGWCSQKGIAPQSKTSSTSSATTPAADSNKSKLTLVQAGVIGAMTTLGVLALVGAILFFARRGRKTGAVPTHSKRVSSDTESGPSVHKA